MKKKNKYFVIMVLFILSHLVFSSSDHVVYWGTSGGPETFDPAQAWDEVSVFFTSSLFDTLVRLNTNTSEIEPSLAVSWEAKSDGKIWVFKLRKGVKFHDGSDFDSSAVVFSFERQMDKKFKYRYYDFPLFSEIFGNIKSVVAIDPHTVVFYLKESFFPFLATITSSGASIVSPAAVKKHKEKFRENPVGTGPFMLKTWEKGKRVVLSRNTNYWRGKPKFDELVSIINPKFEVLHNLFVKGKIDCLDSISISRTVGIKKLRWVTVKLMPTLSVSYIAFNFKNTYLQRENIRKAIRYSWDDRILKYVFQDFVVSLNSILPRGMPGYKEISGKKSFSITKAKELLKKEKISEKISLNFLLLNNTGLERQMISLFSKNLQRVGIELKMINVSQAEYQKRIRKGDFDLAVSGWISDYPDPHSIISSLFYPQLLEQGFANLSSYENEKIRFDIRNAVRESDAIKRREKYKKIIRVINDKVLCIPVFQNTSVVIYNNKKIKQISINAIGNISLFDIETK